VPLWTGLAVTAAVLAVATALGLFLRRRDGRFRKIAEGDRDPGPNRAASEPAGSVAEPLLVSLGVKPGTPVTLLQFSSAFCGPCRTTRVLCADVAARVPGVRHVEVDAESHLDAVRALDIWRTPTVLLVDSDASVRLRASGAPTRAQLLVAVAEVLPAAARAETDVVASRTSG